MQIRSPFEQAGILFLDNDAAGEIGLWLEKKPSMGCEIASHSIDGGPMMTSSRSPCQMVANLEIDH
jgi:hypothetical protein